MSKRPETIAIMADLHCGSRCGLCHPDSEYGKPNKAQKYLWDCWMWLAENWPRPDLLVLNGDVIDGVQKKSEGTGLHTSKMSEQAEMALECLRTLVDKLKPKKLARTAGTPYHEGFHGATSLIDQALGIKTLTEMEPLDIELADGRVLNVKHHPEGGMGLYLGTVQDREALWATIAESRQGLPEATFIIRSHLHIYSRFDGCGKTHVITPSFQLATPWAQKVRYYRYQPSIGAVMLRYNEWDSHKYIVVKKTFKLPKKGATKWQNVK